jgi:uncharacterized protein YfiM (DUF2279 family)
MAGTCAIAQILLEPSAAFNKKRAIGVTLFNAAAWGGSISALGFVWYDDFEKAPFHTFNDGHEWQQMDKIGHAVTSWNFARAGGDLYQWAGVDHHKAATIGFLYSVGYMTTFELLDGFNAEWGFSWGDIGYNFGGSALYFSQQYLWNHQYVKLKFSFHNSGLADYRPNVLGNDFTSRALKDYNGQTYWATFNPVHWFAPDSKIPKWITIALGYSIEDQLYGNGDVYTYIDGSTQLTFNPYRQFYFSLDVDFEEIPTEKRWLKLIFRAANIVKVPFPALELSQGKVAFRPLYF